MAGNRISLSDADYKHASDPLVYGRFEPVPSPVTVMRNVVTEGESVNHIVIRSNYDKPFEEISERHVLPPKTSQTMAEEHHLFDDIGSGMVDKNAYGIIVPREKRDHHRPTGSGQPRPALYDKDIIKVPYLPDPSQSNDKRFPG